MKEETRQYLCNLLDLELMILDLRLYIELHNDNPLLIEELLSLMQNLENMKQELE